MEVDGPTLAATLVALVGGFGWALVGRVKKARRILPRARLRVNFSLRTPSDPPPDELERPELEPPPIVVGDPRPTLPRELEAFDDEKTPPHGRRRR